MTRYNIKAINRLPKRQSWIYHADINRRGFWYLCGCGSCATLKYRLGGKLGYRSVKHKAFRQEYGMLDFTAYWSSRDL